MEVIIQQNFKDLTLTEFKKHQYKWHWQVHASIISLKNSRQSREKHPVHDPVHVCNNYAKFELNQIRIYPKNATFL